MSDKFKTEQLFLPSTKKEAKDKGYTRYFSGKPCIHGHIDARRVGDGNCVACARACALHRQKHNKIYRQQRKKIMKRLNKEYHEKNKDSILARKKEKYHEDIDASREYRRELYWNDPEARRQCTKRYQDQMRMATPGWASVSTIKLFYAMASYRNSLGEEKFHVDHIVPLQGEEVCGLHVHDNLRVVTASENASKSNKLIEGLLV